MPRCYYSATFIAVKEETSVPRCHSCPALGISNSLHDSQQAYVAKLEERAFALAFLGSKGSAGHPEFCRKPCIFLSFPGGCAKGGSEVKQKRYDLYNY